MSEKCLAVVEINQDLCSRCYVCKSICPYEAIKADSSGKVEINSQDCQVCGICYSACPSAAIKMQYYTYDNLSEFLKKAQEKAKSSSETLVLMCRGNSPSYGRSSRHPKSSRLESRQLHGFAFALCRESSN